MNSKTKHAEEQRRYVKRHPERAKESQKKQWDKFSTKLKHRMRLRGQPKPSEQRLRRAKKTQGLPNKGKKWQPEELALIFSKSMTDTEIAIRLQRSAQSINIKRSRLVAAGQHPDGWTPKGTPIQAVY
jgi:hypothetical protein